MADILPESEQAEQKRLSRAERKRAIGGGRNFELDGQHQILLSVIWLRKYPTQEILGYLFGVSDTTADQVAKADRTPVGIGWSRYDKNA